MTGSATSGFPIDAFDRAASDGDLLYRIIKLFDNIPGPGTAVIMGARAAMFFGLRVKQQFYEPVADYETLKAIAYTRGILDLAHAPSSLEDNLVLAFRIFRSAYDAPDGRLILPVANDPEVGIHAVRVVGWDDDGEALVFLNSWGRAWGRQGLGSVTREYIDRYLVEAWQRHDARVGPSRFTWSRLREATSYRQFAQAWMRRNPVWKTRVRVGSRDLRFQNYEGISSQDRCPVDIIELRNPVGVRLGWTFLFHLPDRSTLAKEFFVWPQYRRRGYGRLLESAAAERSRQVGSQELRILLHAVDAVPRARGAGRLFAKALGYSWVWRRTSRPDGAGFALKAL